jgi:Rrf2 family protein
MGFRMRIRQYANAQSMRYGEKAQGAAFKEATGMKLKASVDYGVRAIMYLAVKGGTCSSREISEEMAVPRDYLIQLALRLRNAGLVKARPGKNGGYVLAKPPEEITISQILSAFDTDLKHVRQPMKKGRSASASAQAVRTAHNAITASLDSYLDAITVKTLLDMTDENASSDEVIACALEKEVARLRS